MKTRILFVDDDTLVLQGLQRMLREMRNSWEMEFVESGRQALDRMTAAPFDVVVADMRMPGMNGAQLALEARRLMPHLPILLATGYAEMPKGANIELPRLGKPYSQNELAREISRLLQGGRAPSAASA